jgi:uncharacterized damage-inducible protein DinB
MRALLEEIMTRFADLHKDIAAAIQGLPQEALDWVPGPELNSLGVIIAHTLGAERYLLCDLAAGVRLPRDRDSEFASKGQSAVALVEQMAQSRAAMRAVLAKLSVEDLEDPRITLRDGRKTTVGWAVLYAVNHTALHLGHVQITRQLWERR